MIKVELDYSKLQERIRLANKKGQTQKALSNITGISREDISRVANGKKEPSKRELALYVVAFNTTLDALVEVKVVKE